MITTHEVHYVVFSSPGSFVSEERQKKIDAWSPTLACKMYEDIVERHGAKPYGFHFITMIEAEPVSSWEGEQLEVTPKLKSKSKMYFINGVVETLAEVEARNDPQEDILRSNMRCNGWGRIVTTRNSYKHCAIFNDGDCVVNLAGNITYS